MHESDLQHIDRETLRLAGEAVAMEIRFRWWFVGIGLALGALLMFCVLSTLGMLR